MPFESGDCVLCVCLDNVGRPSRLRMKSGVEMSEIEIGRGLCAVGHRAGDTCLRQ